MKHVSVALASRIAIKRRAPRILSPYNKLEFKSWFPWLNLGLMAIMVLIVAYGALLASLGGTQLLKVAAFPISLLLMAVIWLLPDADRHSNAAAVPRRLFTLSLAFAATIVIWPTYIAVIIPGLPWLTPPRVVLAVLLISLMLHLAQHSKSRAQIVEILGYDKLATRLLLGYWLLTFVIAFRAPSVGDSMYGVFLLEVMSVCVALPVALFLHDRANFKPIYAVVTCTAIYAMLVGVLENYMQIPPWAEYIPSFMRIDDEWLARILSPQARIGDNRYRIRATFPVVLYFALYLSAVLPLVVYAVARMSGRWRLLSFAVMALMLHTTWFTNARSAMIALLIPLFAFPGMIMVRALMQKRKIDVMKIAVRGAVILMLVGMLGGLLATSHRAQVAVFGGTQHVGSNDIRALQWANARDYLRNDPFGIGIHYVQDQIGVELRGKPIVDSYWINVLVGLGPLGFICYYGFLWRCVWLGVLCFLRAKDEFEEWAGAAAVGIFGYTVDQYVVSNSDSAYLPVLYCALVIATKRFQDKRIAEEAKAQQAGAPATAIVRARA